MHSCVYIAGLAGLAALGWAWLGWLAGLPRLGEPSQIGRGNPPTAAGGPRPGNVGPLTSKKLSKNPSRQSLVREIKVRLISIQTYWLWGPFM